MTRRGDGSRSEGAVEPLTSDGARAESEHLSAQEWVDQRAGQATQRSERHLEACASCRRQLEVLDQQAAKLRALPELEPPADLWNGARERILAEREVEQRGRRHRVLALAAAFLLMLAAGWFGWVLLEARAQRQVVRQQISDELATLREQSQLLDSQLRQLARQPSRLSGRQASAMVVLEDAISEVDRQIEELEGQAGQVAPAAVPAWQERVGLQLALIELRNDPVVAYEL